MDTSAKLAIGVGIATILLLVGFNDLYQRAVKEQDCRQVEYDIKILNECEKTTGCTYTYEEMHSFVDRIAACAK